MMRKMYLAMFALITLCGLLQTNAYAQGDVTVSGVVVDMEGLTIPGVTIMLKGTTTGTVTDVDGVFHLKVPEGSTIVASFIGYITEELVASQGKELKITLRDDTKSLEEVVVVGYGTTTRKTVTGAVSTLNSEEIVKSPAANVSGALSGRVPGLLTKQSGGQPGNDNTTLRIRGVGSYASTGVLVLVDGVERDFNTLDPSEIESFSVLKDAASTAIYGIRGADGVLLVTTKRGKLGAPQISVSSNFAVQTPTRMPKSVNSYDYASIYNQARINDGAAPTYTDEDLELYKSGEDPLFHPDTDWAEETLRKYSTQQKYNVNIRGGTEFAKYFVSLGFLNQEGMQKELNQAYNYSNRDSYNRLNIRSNVDMNVTKSTVVSVGLGVNRGDKNRLPDNTYGTVFRMISKAAPNVSPGMWDGKYIFLPDAITQINPMHSMTTGYAQIFENHLDATVEIKQDLDFIIKGLAFKARGAFDNDYNYRIARTKTEQKFMPYLREIDEVNHTVFEAEGDPAELGGASMSYTLRKKRYYGEMSLTYNQQFGKHRVAALVLFNASKRSYNLPSYGEVPTGYLEFVNRVSYNYDEKYLLEFNLGINGSENFPTKSRFGVFPAVSVGWVATNENFFKNAISDDIISFLKIRASYGEVGNDKLGNRRFMYYPGSYSGIAAGLNTTFAFGESPIFEKGYKEDTPGTPTVTWERAIKQNYAIDLKFFNDKLFFTAEYFHDKRDQILTTLNTLPFVTGTSSGIFNIGKVENKGYEFEAGWSSNIGKFNYYIKGNYTFARNKIIERDEAKDPDNPQLWATGRRIGEQMGYDQLGFFQTQEEIDAWPDQFGVVLKPGDVKYRDVNGDGVVNTNDRMPIMHPSFPEISYGISGGFSWKNLDMSFLFQGAANVSLYMSDQFQKPFANLGTMFEFQKGNFWTPDNPNADYPRLSENHATAQNYYTSSIWLKDASYLRLKNLELGYSFNINRVFKEKGMYMRVFLSGQNLFVLDKLDGIIDPENKAGEIMNYPNQRVYNIGVSLRL